MSHRYCRRCLHCEVPRWIVRLRLGAYAGSYGSPWLEIARTSSRERLLALPRLHMMSFLLDLAAWVLGLGLGDPWALGRQWKWIGSVGTIRWL